MYIFVGLILELWHRETYITHKETNKLSCTKHESNSLPPDWGNTTSCQLSGTLVSYHKNCVKNTIPGQWHGQSSTGQLVCFLRINLNGKYILQYQGYVKCKCIIMFEHISHLNAKIAINHFNVTYSFLRTQGLWVSSSTLWDACRMDTEIEQIGSDKTKMNVISRAPSRYKDRLFGYRDSLVKDKTVRRVSNL